MGNKCENKVINADSLVEKPVNTLRKKQRKCLYNVIKNQSC
jgi:hypothetical protein